MFKVGEVISSFGPNGEEHYIVVEVDGTNPYLEKVEDYILRRYSVYHEGEYRTLGEIITLEKSKIINKGYLNV